MLISYVDENSHLNESESMISWKALIMFSLTKGPFTLASKNRGFSKFDELTVEVAKQLHAESTQKPRQINR